MAAARRRRAAAPRYVTKPGRHGTLYRFKIIYRSDHDPGFGQDEWFTWAYDVEHAEDKFYESDDDGWWRIVSTSKVRE